MIVSSFCFRYQADFLSDDFLGIIGHSLEMDVSLEPDLAA
jgi:hypothetical protein